MKNGLIILLIATIFLVLLIFLLSDSPLQALFYFFIGPFKNLYNFGNMLNSATPFIFGALGIIIAMKAGSLNLGGEGQVYLGAFVTTVCALSLSVFGFFGAFAAAIIGTLCAGLLSGISGLCKAKWNVNELITTFLLSCAVIPIINYLVQVPFLDPETSLISTKKITESMRLPFILKPSSLNLGFLIALILVLFVNLFLNKTRMGYEFRMAGFNEMFARYGGINTKINTVLAMTMSGALYGLAGSIVVLGTHHAVIKEFSAGLGWSGLTVALFAYFSPAAVIPCALFLAWINTGARFAMYNTGLTYEIVYMVQAVIFILSASMIFKKGKNKC